MLNISEKVKKCVRNFCGMGGLSGAVVYVIQDDLQSAVIISFIVGFAAVVDTWFLDP